ncbi:MAG: DNA polymerase III subunit [Actinomycetota bacterium]
MFAEVVGQERAIATLERAAERPSHAYLLVAPRGSGVEVAARAFAGTLIGAPDDRGRKLVARGLHPDVVEFEPGGPTYRVDDVRERILPEAHRSPVEGARKVLLVFEAEKLCVPPAIAANALLKTLEEPPARIVVVLVTASADELLPTIRSRCQRIDFDPVSDAKLRATLEGDGVRPDVAALAAGLSGGQLARACALAGPLASLRHTFASTPARVTGTGANALALAEQMNEAVDAAAEEVARRHGSELAEFDAEMERYGYADREVQRMRRRIDDRHKREARRARIDLLIEGVTAIETVYRDALAATAPALNIDQPRLAVSARAAVDALDACRDAREAFTINEKGLVRLTALVLCLPPVAS